MKTNEIQLSYGAVLSVETVTKSQAARWLRAAEGTNVRNIAPNYVKRLTDDMNDNKFMSHSCIIFDRNGLLCDGQHRLSAFVASNLESAEFILLQNVPQKVLVQVDTGMKRSAGQVLKSHGFSDTNTRAATARRVLARRDGCEGPMWGSSFPTYTTNQILEFCESEASEMDLALAVGHEVYKSSKALPASTVASFFMVASAVDRRVTEDMFSELTTTVIRNGKIDRDAVPSSDDITRAAVSKLRRSLPRLEEAKKQRTHQASLEPRVHDDAWLTHTFNMIYAARTGRSYPVAPKGNFKALSRVGSKYNYPSFLPPARKSKRASVDYLKQKPLFREDQNLRHVGLKK